MSAIVHSLNQMASHYAIEKGMHSYRIEVFTAESISFPWMITNIDYVNST